MATTDWIERLNSLAKVDDLENAFTRLLLLPIAAFFVQAANLVEAIFDLMIKPLTKLGGGVGEFIDSFVGGSADLVDAGVEASSTQVDVFGIVAFPVSLALVGGALLVMAYILSRDETSDTLPFTFTDIPLVGIDEDEE